MVRIVLSLILMPCILSNLCMSQTNEKLTSIELRVNYPLSFYKEKNETKIYNLKDTIQIWYYSNCSLYRLPPTLDFKTGKKINGTEPYFLFNKNNKFGFLFTSLKDKNIGIRYPVDSFLSNRGMKGKDFDIPPDSLWKRIDYEKEMNNDSFLEKYAAVKAADETIFDSIYYYYSKNFRNTEYSFSRKLDSIKRMKLYKIRLVYNEEFSPSSKSILPKREFIFEISDKELKTSELIIEFINRFKKCCDSNNWELIFIPKLKHCGIPIQKKNLLKLNGAYYEQYKMNLPPREFLYEMSEIPIKDSAGVMAYFNKYKKGVLN